LPLCESICWDCGKCDCGADELESEVTARVDSPEFGPVVPAAAEENAPVA